MRAFVRQAARDGLADAPAAAGDQGDLVLETWLHDPLLVVLIPRPSGRLIPCQAADAGLLVEQAHQLRPQVERDALAGPEIDRLVEPGAERARQLARPVGLLDHLEARNAADRDSSRRRAARSPRSRRATRHPRGQQAGSPRAAARPGPRRRPASPDRATPPAGRRGWAQDRRRRPPAGRAGNSSAGCR